MKRYTSKQRKAYGQSKFYSELKQRGWMSGRTPEQKRAALKLSPKDAASRAYWLKYAEQEREDAKKRKP